VLIEVRAPDTTDIYDAAYGVAVPDGGVITLSVAPVPQRLGQILRPALEALDAVPLARSASGTAQEAENALARLRAHGVHTLILLNARWVPSALRAGLAAAATMAGLRLFVLHHPHDDPFSPFVDWTSETWEWTRFTSWAARQLSVWEASAQAPEQSQRALLPALGLHNPVAVPARTPRSAPSRRAYADLQRLLRHRSEPAAVLAHVRHVVQAADGDMQPAILEGLTAALDEAGYALLDDGRPRDSSGLTTSMEWRDLRGVADAAGAAAVTLLALGHDERSAARLSGADIEPDGSLMPLRGRRTFVDPAARSFLLAQRLLVAPGAPLLSSPRGEVVPATVRRMAADALSELGVDMGVWLTSRLRPSQRWLVERGLMLRQLPTVRWLVQQPRSVSGERLCRHGLPGWIAVGAAGVSHSRRLCAAESFEEARPSMKGYSVAAAETAADTRQYAVKRDGLPAGALWSIATPRSAVWVQSFHEPPADTRAVAMSVVARQT